MFANYIKSALRALLKYKGTTLINVLGLSIGLLSVLMISIYVYSEMSYDKFNENADRIYRIGVVGKMQGNDLNMAVTSGSMARALVDEYPEVEEAVKIYSSGSHMIKYENTTFNEESGKVLFVDSTFFKIFSFKLIQGNPDNALTTKQKNNLDFEVLSDSHQEVIKAYNLQFDPGADYHSRRDLTQVNGDGSKMLPVPATFIINQDFTIIAAHVEANYTKRMSAQDILGVLRIL